MTDTLNETQTPNQTTLIVENTDTGSLRITDPGQPKPTTGCSIQITGESKPRKTSYIMGSDKKGWFCCCRGTGPFPKGTVEVAILAE